MLLDKYLPRIEFDSYEDFKENYRVNIPDDFNFGFDIVDEWAKQEPEKKALVWCNDHGEEKTFTFTDISRLSNQTANYFQSLGIRKGTVVMLILRRRWEYWVCAVALHKIGAILIPGSLQLAKKDLIYRGNSAQIHTMVCLDDKPSKLGLAIHIAKKTMGIARQNIVFALGVKAIVLVLGALGLAHIGAAVFADVGVSVIAILNSTRAMRTKVK